MALLRFVASIRNMNNRLNLPQRRYINNTLKVYDITTGINANRNKSEKSYYNITWHAYCNGVANCNKSRQNCPPWDITTVDKPVIYVLSYPCPIRHKKYYEVSGINFAFTTELRGSEELWYPKHFSGSKLLSNWNPHQTTKLLSVLRFGAVCPFVYSITLLYGQIDCAIRLKLCHNTHFYLMVRPTD